MLMTLLVTFFHTAYMGCDTACDAAVSSAAACGTNRTDFISAELNLMTIHHKKITEQSLLPVIVIQCNHMTVLPASKYPKLQNLQSLPFFEVFLVEICLLPQLQCIFNTALHIIAYITRMIMTSSQLIVMKYHQVVDMPIRCHTISLTNLSTSSLMLYSMLIMK